MSSLICHDDAVHLNSDRAARKSLKSRKSGPIEVANVNKSIAWLHEIFVIQLDAFDSLSIARPMN